MANLKNRKPDVSPQVAELLDYVTKAELLEVASQLATASSFVGDDPSFQRLLSAINAGRKKRGEKELQRTVTKCRGCKGQGLSCWICKGSGKKEGY